MAKKESALGKGLSAIFGESIDEVLEGIQQGANEEYRTQKSELPLAQIKPNPYQPRKEFDEDKLQELADSIALHGVFTPILVKQAVQGYELISGERRLRASKLAGKEYIPAIIVDFDDQQMMEIALLENVQREDLNAIEEALGYEKLIQRFAYTQEELARRVGKSREHVANLLRLLKLPPAVQNYVVTKQLSMGHVRALLALKDASRIEETAQAAIRLHLSVRAVETMVKNINEPKQKTLKQERSVQMDAIEHRLQGKFQTKVTVDDKTIIFRYQGTQDLNRLLELLDCLEEEL
ncbi:MAG: ParB/RepB/Spo0J family partition protein [Erysipelotrichaceae bacterium]|nr:ParB/RepB/Spo0J family partition protein [Erysipelotrichaceae bacterium]MCI9312878.1 ParB/RepB/Spo0J family partition protein [Erysipelotrichaceae bacterium]